MAFCTKMTIDRHVFTGFVCDSNYRLFLCIGKATAKPNEVDLFGPNLMDDFIDASAATPATDSAVEPQVDLFADADFQSAPADTETAARTDVQVCFSIC